MTYAISAAQGQSPRGPSDLPAARMGRKPQKSVSASRSNSGALSETECNMKVGLSGAVSWLLKPWLSQYVSIIN